MTTNLPLLRRALFVLVIGAIAVASTACEPAPPGPPPPPVGGSGEVAQLTNLVNAYRNANGLPSVVQAGDAMAKAQQHSQDMAAATKLFHSSSLTSGIQPGWKALGENVGVGPTINTVEIMFELSSTHKANLLNPAYNQVGIGVAHGADGQVYVTEFFVGR